MVHVRTSDVGLTLVSFDAGFGEMQVNSFQAIFIISPAINTSPGYAECLFMMLGVSGESLTWPSEII